MEITWQEEFTRNWRARKQHGRLPHAVMLAGPVGTGKRAAAAWLAASRLDLAAAERLPVYPLAIPEHPDLRWLAPAEDKEAIGIEQIRELVQDLSLTSYAGGGKVAVIEPANAMTVNAANSLLKTLEEPPGDALLVLVADRTGRLPATIFSRCQRIDFAPPPVVDALAWLDRLQPGAAWAEALQAAGGAPLAAIEALESLATSKAMAEEFKRLGQGAGSPVEVAKRWSQMDPGYVLNWLAQQVKLVIIAALTGRTSGGGPAIDESVLRRMDRRNLFCYLDIINRLRGQPRGSYNVQLTLESLLIDWTEGLAECGPDLPLDGLMNLMLAGQRGHR